MCGSRLGDDHPKLVMADMDEIVLAGGCQIGVPAKYEAREQEGVQFDEFITPEPMSGRDTDWARLSES